MRRSIPIIVGVILLVLGIGWAAQGAGVLGGGSLMDNNVNFIYLGGLLGVIGIVLVAYGALSRPKKGTGAARNQAGITR